MEAGHNQYTEPCGNFPQGSGEKTRDQVGEALGMSGKTYQKAKETALQCPGCLWAYRGMAQVAQNGARSLEHKFYIDNHMIL